MIKSKIKLTIPLCGLLLLSSCRTEELLHEAEQKEELSKKFITFTKKHENDVIDYGAGFKSLALRYDSIHKTNMTGRADIAKLKEELQTNNKMSFSTSNEVAYIDFNVRSQLMEEENGDKWMVFPKVKGGKVKDLVIALLSEEETKLGYYLVNEDSDVYREVTKQFTEAYKNKAKNLNYYKSYSYKTYGGTTEIEEVIIRVPKPKKPRNPAGPSLPSLPQDGPYDMTECIYFNDCMSGGDDGGGYAPPPDLTPCEKAKKAAEKANSLAKSNFLGAKDEILNAYKYGVGIDKKGQGMENGVAFGYDRDNDIEYRTEVQHFGKSSGTIVSKFDYPTADMHNHPEDDPPSPGDVYSMMQFHLEHNTFRTRYVVLSDGTMYALVVTDTNAIREFLQKYPYKQNPGHGPNFSGEAWNTYENMGFEGYTDEVIMAHILTKYNAGISLTKMDNSGSFKPINIKEIEKDGERSYEYAPCS